MSNRVKSSRFAPWLRRSWPCQPLTSSRKHGLHKLPNFNLGITKQSPASVSGPGFPKALGCLYKSLLSLLEQGVFSIYRCFIVIIFPEQRFCCLATKYTYHWIVCWHQLLPPGKNSYTPLRAVSLLRKSNRRVIDTGNGCADPTNQNIDSFTKRTDGLHC